MRSTFHGLETAKRALSAQQYALYTVGHNVANANTPGYSRQRVNFGTMAPLDPIAANRSAIPGQIGTGVKVRDVVRLRESFLDHQFRNEQERFGALEARLDTLEKLEAMFQETADGGKYGLAAIMDEFWAAWHTLSESPEKSTNRVVVIEKMRTMVEAFNMRARQLGDLEGDLKKNVDLKYDEAHQLLERIAELNEQIAKIEASGDNANDLRDRRDLLVDDLSKLIDIHVDDPGKDGPYTIQLASGSDEEGDPPVLVQGTWIIEKEGLKGEDLTISGGEISGLEASLEMVKQYQVELDIMVRTLAEGKLEVTLPAGTVLPENYSSHIVDGESLEDKIENGELTESAAITVYGLNGLHALGWNAKGESGGNLFVPAEEGEPITAGNIRVSPELLRDERLLAAANHQRVDGDGNPIEGEDGVLESSNGIALLMAQLKEDGIFLFSNENENDGGNDENGITATIPKGTIGDYYTAYSAKIGIHTDSTKKSLQNQLTILNMIDMRRDSVSAVSIDEELSNMIMFQHAYNAAARNMTVIDEMLDRIINGMGHVGR